jgi:hypothetical protein
VSLNTYAQVVVETARYVRRGGGQAEILLRVKQGCNPRFGFLDITHPLHPYFTWHRQQERQVVVGVCGWVTDTMGTSEHSIYRGTIRRLCSVHPQRCMVLCPASQHTAVHGAYYGAMYAAGVQPSSFSVALASLTAVVAWLACRLTTRRSTPH